MCRNIRLLHHFEPPTTEEEIRAAALQFVRKVSGTREPSRTDREVFDRAVEQVAAATTALLTNLTRKGEPHTRETEAAKGRARWEARAARMATVGAQHSKLTTSALRSAKARARR
ncbi:MAG: DUF2277 domain-containing protein [Myxococcota bacterium]